MQAISYKRKIITVAIAGGLMLLTGTIQAQLSVDYLRAADNYFKKSDYSSASAYYEKYLQGASGKSPGEHEPYAIKGTTTKAAPASSKLQALYQLAESYRMLTLYDKAAPLYQQIVENNAAQFPLASYQHAIVLRAQGKYEEAEKAINSFLNTYKTEDSYSVSAQRELLNLRFIQEQLKKKDVSDYTISKLGEGKEGASYAPVWTDNNTLLFTATWPDGKAGKSHTNHLYEASFNSGSLGNVARAGLPATDMHEGAAAVSADGSTLYLTRWMVKDGRKTAAIYISKKTTKDNTGQWSAPVALSTVVNTAGANTQQPFIMPGGKQLLYVSDKAGGLGGYDIWIAELNAAGEPVSTTNLGNSINTPFNEQAPYYHAASATLVFASEGRVGMGGYDLFYSKGTPGHWDAPVNFGYPVNSIKDDMYFASHGTSDNILENVVLSSDRTATCCLELMQLQKHIPVAVVPKPDTTVVVAAPVKEPVKEEPPMEETAILENVFYEINKATIMPPSYPALDKVAEVLNAHPTAKVEIGGHTDDTGSDERNQQLSEERAANVVAYLVSKGVDKSRLSAKGYGASRPIAPNRKPDGSDNPEGREKNRRTEMRVLSK